MAGIKRFAQTPGASVCLAGQYRAGRLPHLSHFIFAPSSSSVQEHQHRYLLPDHLERHPDRSLAALASDPLMALGLKLGGGLIWHRRIKA
jgi:hypothetical protein